MSSQSVSTRGSRVRIASLGLLIVIVLIPTPAWPCSVDGPLPSAETLVHRSDVIVRVRAETVAPKAVWVHPAAPSHVNFTVLEIVKGELSSGTLSFNGVASERDDRNDRPVPYDFVRPAGRGGGCFAIEYRLGSEYLLLLKKTGDPDRSILTPYWAALRPTNEQLFDGHSDPWFRWVLEHARDGASQVNHELPPATLGARGVGPAKFSIQQLQK